MGCERALQRMSLLLLPLLASGRLMGQAAGSRTASALTISMGAGQGQYDEDITHEYGPNGLGLGLGGYTTRRRRLSYYHTYATLGGNVAYRVRPESTRGVQTVGLGIWAGREQVGYRRLAPDAPFQPAPTDASTRLRLYDFNPYVEGRFSLGRLGVGYRAGLHVGRLRNGAAITADSSLTTTWLAPDAQLWVGIRRVLFAQFDSGAGQLALGNHTSRFGLGSGLGADNGRFLLAGLAVATHEPGYNMAFLSAGLPLGHTGFGVEAYSASDFSRHHQLQVMLHYQLPGKAAVLPAAN